MPNKRLKPGWMERQAEMVRQEIAQRPEWLGHINNIPRDYDERTSGYKG